ncbi:DUF418 domain-containing protein [Nesterenkonia sphaerica]|uniref:DUF418 domain-containing protein n=1 Tax=Nesterenkonia sphaerica TaxID=1804988 RepID=A0A5R9A840_9MICC|nr:DUF418 domain-containing protein [Nesterenkonia sphaerica]TLP74077.1 DUF418 domain-containing protein [Nesterenkonia sphaerica]
MSPDAGSRSPRRPAPRWDRISALDAARGLAILGMVAVNVGPRGGDSLAEILYRAPHGRASLLFVLLGGISFALLTRRSWHGGMGTPWGKVLWRATLLLAVGLLLQELDHGLRVILTTYAALFLLGLPLARARGRLLLLLAGVSVSLGPVLWILMQEHTDKAFDREPVTAASMPGEILTGTLLTGPYPAVVWAAPFLFGMWLGRQNLTDSRVSTRMVLWGGVTAVATRAVSFLLISVFGEPTGHTGWQRLVSDVAHSEMPLWMLGSTGAAVFVLGVCLKVGDWTRLATKPLADLGRLAFTAYVLHLVVIALLVRPGPETLLGGVTTTAVLGAALILFAVLWLLVFPRGPFELLLSVPRLRPDTQGRNKS